MPAGLRPGFAAEQDAERRPFNRAVVTISILIFDLFLLAQRRSAPELVPLSALLRLGFITPATLLFLGLDRAGKLGRAYDPALVALAVAAFVISGVLCVRTTSLTTLSDIRTTPLMLLATGLIWRQPPLAVMTNAGLSATCFILAVAGSPVVPRAELGSLFMEVLAIAAASTAFSLQLERRDRRVFLLTLRETIRREAVAAHNRGLLAEVQTDALTGVANRRGFEVALAAGWAAALTTLTPLALIMIDIDHFKKFNDFYGHQGGDDCLRRVAGALRAEVRGRDLVARYGGEEFCVVMPGATLETAALVAERIRGAVAGLRLPHAGVAADAVVSISLGVASRVPSGPAGAGGLVELADQSLYAAKRAGRNRVVARDGLPGGEQERDRAVGLGGDQATGEHRATAGQAYGEPA